MTPGTGPFWAWAPVSEIQKKFPLTEAAFCYDVQTPGEQHARDQGRLELVVLRSNPLRITFPTKCSYSCQVL